MLCAVIAFAEAGDWDQVQALDSEVRRLQQEVVAALPVLATAKNKSQLEEILEQNKRAMQLCRERMTVIEPLVQTLASQRQAVP